MTEINLLPWRELKREHEKKAFIILLLTAMLAGAAIVVLGIFYANNLIDNQKYRNNRLQSEINSFNKQIKEINRLKEIRQALISRMMIVQDLQATRPLTIHLFDELIKVVPDGVHLSMVKRANNMVTVQGYAESNSNVSIMMRNIENNPWIQNPALTEIKKGKDTKDVESNEFKLSFVIKPKIKYNFTP